MPPTTLGALKTRRANTRCRKPGSRPVTLTISHWAWALLAIGVIAKSLPSRTLCGYNLSPPEVAEFLGGSDETSCRVAVRFYFLHGLCLPRACRWHAQSRMFPQVTPTTFAGRLPARMPLMTQLITAGEALRCLPIRRSRRRQPISNLFCSTVTIFCRRNLPWRRAMGWTARAGPGCLGSWWNRAIGIGLA